MITSGETVENLRKESFGGDIGSFNLNASSV
jgi:hypothetical protein